MTAGEAPLRALLAETRAAVAADPALAAFAGPLDWAELPFQAPAPRALPAMADLAAYPALASAATLPLCQAIRAAAPHLHWRQSYTERQVGAEFLAGYGWFNLVSPEGPFVAEGIRISFGTWRAGLHYPRHWHAPEEIYLVVAGAATFVTDGMADAVLGPGGTRRHPANVPHSARMDHGPLLAMAIWKGERLMQVSALAGENAG